MKQSIVIVNFGGPRSLAEVEPFLISLLTDKDVIRTKLPGWIQDVMFKQIAKKRAKKISCEYEEMGGASPIFGDTEAIAQMLKNRFGGPVITFHRYLNATHHQSIELIEKLQSERIIVFPMFPQFSYATSGSVARFFQKKLHPKTLEKMCWVRSYPTQPHFIALWQKKIKAFIQEKNLVEEEMFLLFSAHGLPKTFFQTGDPYSYECEKSVTKILEGLPKLKGLLCYQSKFGPGQWLSPYTEDVASKIQKFSDRKSILFVPISFTSDHIETLIEIEKKYIPLIQKNKYEAYRLSAFNRSIDWVNTIEAILEDFIPSTTQMLVRC